MSGGRAFQIGPAHKGGGPGRGNPPDVEVFRLGNSGTIVSLWHFCISFSDAYTEGRGVTAWRRSRPAAQRAPTRRSESRTAGIPDYVIRLLALVRYRSRILQRAATESQNFVENPGGQSRSSTKHPHYVQVVSNYLRTNYRLRLPCWKSPQPLKSPDSLRSPGRVNGCAVLRCAPVLRVTRLARCGTVAVKAEMEPFGPVSGRKFLTISDKTSRQPDEVCSSVGRARRSSSSRPAHNQPIRTSPATS